MPGKKMSNMGKESQHYQRHIRGNWAGREWGLVGTIKLQKKHNPCTFARSSAQDLTNLHKKRSENHYAITITDALPLVFRVMKRTPQYNKYH